MNSLFGEDPVRTLSDRSLLFRGYVPGLRVDDVDGLAHKPNSLDLCGSTTQRHVLLERSPSVVEHTQTVLDHGSPEPSVPETAAEGYACSLLASLLGSPHIHDVGAATSPKLATIKVEADAPCGFGMRIKKESDDDDPHIPSPSEEGFPPLAYGNLKSQSSVGKAFGVGPEPSVGADRDAFRCDTPMSDPLLPEVVEQEQLNIRRSLAFEQCPAEQPPAYNHPFGLQYTENYHAARSYERTLALARRLALARQMGRIYRHVSFGRRAPDGCFFDPLFGEVAPRPLSKSLHGVPLQSASHTGGHHLASDSSGSGSLFHPSFNYGNQNAQDMGHIQGDQGFVGSASVGGSPGNSQETELQKNVRRLWELVEGGFLNFDLLPWACYLVAGPPSEPTLPDLGLLLPMAPWLNDHGLPADPHGQANVPPMPFQSQIYGQVPLINSIMAAGPGNNTFEPGQHQPPDDPTTKVAQGVATPQVQAPFDDDASSTLQFIPYSPANDNTKAAETGTESWTLVPGQKVCPVPQCRRSFKRPSLLQDHMHTHGGPKRHQCARCDASFVNKSGLRRHNLHVHDRAAQR